MKLHLCHRNCRLTQLESKIIRFFRDSSTCNSNWTVCSVFHAVDACTNMFAMVSCHCVSKGSSRRIPFWWWMDFWCKDMKLKPLENDLHRVARSMNSAPLGNRVCHKSHDKWTFPDEFLSEKLCKNNNDPVVNNWNPREPNICSLRLIPFNVRLIRLWAQAFRKKLFCCFVRLRLCCWSMMNDILMSQKVKVFEDVL